MTYVLKTRAISGALVPLNGEHIEYTDLEIARKDARVWASVSEQPVSIIDFQFGDVVEVVG